MMQWYIIIFYSALHLSARNGLVAVTRLLLEKGAAVLAVDCNGLTPALACAPTSAVAHCLALILASTPTANNTLLQNSKYNDYCVNCAHQLDRIYLCLSHRCIKL